MTSTLLTASIIFSAPSSTPTVTFFFFPIISIEPAGIRLSFTSPSGVLITTAERLPINARAIGTTCFVSSEERLNKVAIPYGLERTSTTPPTGATSTAHFMPRGTFSTIPTSSTIGIFFSSRLLIKTPSSRWTMAPVIFNILLYWLIIFAAASKEILDGITTITSVPDSTLSSWSIISDIPTPIPIPPGVLGLCPIIVDSVIIVSVIVSIATSPITGAASFTRTSSRSLMSSPTLSRAFFRD